MERAQGKGVFIIGVARGQGRSRAVRQAWEGVGTLAGGLAHGMAAFRHSLATRDGAKETAWPVTPALGEAMRFRGCPGDGVTVIRQSEGTRP